MDPGAGDGSRGAEVDPVGQGCGSRGGRGVNLAQWH